MRAGSCIYLSQILSCFVEGHVGLRIEPALRLSMVGFFRHAQHVDFSRTMSFLELEGLHVFVTGAAGGIGSAIVEEFLGRCGFCVGHFCLLGARKRVGLWH